MKQIILLVSMLLVSSLVTDASNLANPAVNIPPARIAIGASYHLGGYSLTNDTIPSLFNRFHGRLEYTPIKYLTIGIDGGATQIDVESYLNNNDSVPVFHGEYGFSAGGHIKLATPSFLNKRFSAIAIAQGTMFTSENKNQKARYSGKDATGVIGLQFHIPGFGYISAGPLVYLIDGENESFDGTKNYYSNVDNVRGWLSVDYFPKVSEVSKNKPYISFEFSISPHAAFSERVAIEAFSFSISIGSITKRLYGTESEVEWNP